MKSIAQQQWHQQWHQQRHQQWQRPARSNPS